MHPLPVPAAARPDVRTDERRESGREKSRFELWGRCATLVLEVRDRSRRKAAPDRSNSNRAASKVRLVRMDGFALVS